MRFVALVALVGLVALPAACSTAEPAAKSAAQPLTSALLLGLAEAKNYHHRADVHLADGDAASAADDVKSILAIAFPQGDAEGEEALLDARARLAKLDLGLGRAADARQVVDEGLASTSRESFFLANLYTVSGELHEAAAHQLDDAQAARSERQAALADYDRSLQIDQHLQQELLK
jgi:hypothetical protein